MSVIPIMTSLGDLFGSAFILIAFIILEQLNDPNALFHEEPATFNVTSGEFNSTITTAFSTILNDSFNQL